MKQQILNRIAELGGDISQTTRQSLIDDLQKITFKEVLHFKRPDEEPFYDFYPDFYDKNRELAKNPEQFINKAINDYYGDFIDNIIGIDEAKWYGKSLANFNNVDLLPLSEVINKQTPKFLVLVYGYGYPKNYFYFICSNDINPDNPTVFKTNQDIDFNQMEKVGTLSEFLNRFMTKQEARVAIQEFLDDVTNGEVD